MFHLPPLLTIPIITGLLAQILKFTIKSIRRKKISWHLWEGYGGIPSVHTTLVISLITVIALSESITSSAFSVAIVFAVLTIRDALGLRKFLGDHGKILNMLISDMPEKYKSNSYPEHLRENLGHSMVEVIAGAGFGVIVSTLLYFLI